MISTKEFGIFTQVFKRLSFIGEKSLCNSSHLTDKIFLSLGPLHAWYHACFLSYSCPLGEKRQITFKLPRLIRNPRRLDAPLCAAGSKKCADSIAVKSLGNRTAPAPPYFCASYSGTETLDYFAYKRKWTNAMATLGLVRKGDDSQKKLGTQICCASQHDTQVCLSSRHDLSLHLYSPTMLMLPNGITQCNLLSQ